MCIVNILLSIVFVQVQYFLSGGGEGKPERG